MSASHSICCCALLIVGAGCDDGATNGTCMLDDTYHPALDPGIFTSDIDHPLFPLPQGSSTVFIGGDERVEVTVTSRTQTIRGVECREVRDTVTVDGSVVEDTFDWYAQDVDGNVWYFGEYTQEYEEGEVVTTHGSWKAGIDDARPGIIMLASPHVGDSYRQEYYPCEAEDMADVLAVGENVSVPVGDFTDCIRTVDYTPLEPAAREEKVYCPGVGLVLIVDLSNGERTELVEATGL